MNTAGFGNTYDTGRRLAVFKVGMLNLEGAFGASAVINTLSCT